MSDVVELAEQAVRDNDAGRALAMLEGLRAQQAEQHQHMLSTAATLSRLGHLDEADALLAQGERLFPRFADATIARARMARDKGKLQIAAELLAAVRSRVPDDPQTIIESGWLAHVAQDWPQAAAWWEQTRMRTPQHVVGFVNGAVAARRLGRMDEADNLLRDAMRRFPDHAEPAIDHAWLAQDAGAWVEAESRWQQVRDRFPDQSSSYTGAALALRQQGRFDAADRLLEEAARRFPTERYIVAERCWVAHVAHDWPEAVRRWDDLRTRHPDMSVGYTSGAVALREIRRYAEADSLLREAIRLFPTERTPWVEHAWLASAQRDWPEAAKRWATVRERFPDFSEGWLRGAMAFAEHWQYDAAAAVLEMALVRFPQDGGIAVEYANLAMRQNLVDDAAARFADVRARFPALIEGHLGCALVLRNQFRLSEAEAVLEAAKHGLPQQPRVWLDHAMLPVFSPMRRDRDPEEALRRLGDLRARFPDFAEGWLSAVRLLREEGQLQEAEALGGEAMTRLPNSSAIAAEHASLAGARGDWAEAQRRYAAMHERFPDDASGSIGLAQALAATGQQNDGEDILRGVIARFPATSAGYVAYAELAMQREDWPEALSRWTEAQRHFPDDRAFAQRIFDVRLRLTESDGAPALTTADAQTAADDPRAEMRDLVMRFESLGGRGIGCEFGMFQREFGAEPLGLLRWADMPYEGIIAVLESRFEGVGAPENTEVFVNRENGRPEYCTRDLRGFMFMRAFAYEDELPMERMRKQALRRLSYLKDKLIADLEAGEKIFLWRCTERTLTEAELHRLHQAVRRYGDNTLLYVRYQDADHPNGTVVAAAPGLLIGYIDRFKMAPDGTLASAPPSASWTEICRRAVQF